MSPMLAMVGGDKEVAVAAELPLLSTHLQVFGVVVVASIVALSARWLLSLLLL